MSTTMLQRDQKTGHKVVRALTALVALAVLLIAVPWVILQWGAWQDCLAIVNHPTILFSADDGHVVLAIITVLGAVFWLVLVLSILLEMAYAIRERSLKHSLTPLRSGLLLLPRRLVRPLISAVFALSFASVNLPAVAEPPNTDPISLIVPTWPSSQSQQTGVITSGMYEVGPGDSLWSIAQQAYGDGRQWSMIAEANEDLLLGSPNLIQVGWQLRIPAIEDTPAPLCHPDEPIVVKPGDSLWAIAETQLGDPNKWPKIAEANQDLIEDPSLIIPGWKLDIPCDEPTSPDQTPETIDATILEPPSVLPALEPIGSIPAFEPLLDQVDTAIAESVGNTIPASELTPASPTTPDLGSNDQSNLSAVLSAAGTSAIIAGGITLMVRRRRLSQLRARPLGRRIIHPDQQSAQLEAALSVAGSHTGAISARLDKLFMSTVCDEDQAGEPNQTVSDSIALEQVNPNSDVSALLPCKQVNPDSSISPLLPAAVSGVELCLGTDEAGNAVNIDVAGPKPFLICARWSDDLTSVVAGITMGLAIDEWYSEVDLHVVSDTSLFSSFDSLELHTQFDEAMDSLKLVIADRRTFIGNEAWSQLKNDPNRGEAWRPVVYVFTTPLSASQFQELVECISDSDVGVAVLAARVVWDPSEILPLAASILEVETADQARLLPIGLPLQPLKLQTGQPLSQLLTTSISQETTPAWWSQIPENPPATETLPVSPSGERGIAMMSNQHRYQEIGTTSATVFSHPTLRLLGPIVLDGAQGVPPPRAERACMEYCGWLLEYPGTTATAMAQGLLVAEGTRRSNMSRLRTWLGHDHIGNAYLPEAYSGRIWLDAAVSSDWQRMCLLIASSIESTSLDCLIQALELVRGAPLADAAPGQWHWAEEMRTDMVSIIRDIGVVATNLCIAERDIDRARWAASRALVAAPEDEALLCARVLTEHTAGNRFEVERLVAWIARNARNLGVDLLPDTAVTLRDVIKTGSPFVVRR